jgi:hypothetical protein
MTCSAQAAVTSWLLSGDRTVWDEDFDPDRPGLHASYMAIQVEAWDQVQQSIETQANWIEQPQLLRRYAQACARLQQHDRAVCCWFRLCWGPGQAETVGREAEPIWQHRWQRFAGLEPELLNRDFPAWSLLEQLGMV